MRFHQSTSEVFVPDKDDIEIMAAQPIIEGFQENDTWFSGVDETTGLSYGMEMTPLIDNPTLEPAEFIRRFADDVQERVNRIG